MKFETQDLPRTGFVPFTLTVTVETEEELRALRNAFLRYVDHTAYPNRRAAVKPIVDTLTDRLKK